MRIKTKQYIALLMAAQLTIGSLAIQSPLASAEEVVSSEQTGDGIQQPGADPIIDTNQISDQVALDELGIKTAELPEAVEGTAYSVTLEVYGGEAPYTYAAEGLPAGLVLDEQSGILSGTLSAGTEGTYRINLEVSDQNAEQPQTVSKELSLQVSSAATAHFSDQIKLRKIGSYQVGVTNADGGVAEIVRFNKDNGSFYLVNGAIQPPTVDIVKLTPEGATEKVKSIDVAALVDSDTFQVGDLTSVDINTKEKYVAVAVQEEASEKAGKVLILDYEGELITSYSVGVQPDMVKISSDGSSILTADEGEPREGNAYDPQGSVTIIDYKTGEAKTVLFDDPSVIDDNVHIRGEVNIDGIIINEGSKEKAITDLEPEYIALSPDNKLAYVSLQENNAIATVDIAAGKVLSVKGLGAKDWSKPGNEIDLIADGQIKLENVPVKSLYMPDGIATYTVDGQTYLFTANEGDATDWTGMKNELKVSDIKKKFSLSQELGTWLNATKDYDKVRVMSDMGMQDGTFNELYLYGARSFSIWNTGTMEQVYDSGSDFEQITAERQPEYFNVSNDNEDMDDRSPKKGPEPEYVTVGKAGNKAFAFTGLERTGGVMTYDVTNPEQPFFVNYTNTREFGQEDMLATDTGPEGLEYISALDSPTGRPLLLVANEVGGTVAILEMEITKVTLDQKEISIEEGSEGGKLQASVDLVGSTEAGVVWSSSQPEIASVDESGQIKALKPGSAVIHAVSKDGYGEAEAIVTVTEKGTTALGPGPVDPTPSPSPETPGETNPSTPEQPSTGGQYVIGQDQLIVTTEQIAGGNKRNHVTVQPDVLKQKIVEMTASKEESRSLVINASQLVNDSELSIPMQSLLSLSDLAKKTTIQFVTAEGSYELPLSVLAEASGQSGMRDGTLQIRIAPLQSESLSSLEKQAATVGARYIKGTATSFSASVLSAQGEQQAIQHKTYLSREVTPQDGVLGQKLTAVRINEKTGGLMFTPSVRKSDGTYEIKSIQDGDFALVSLSKTFTDMNKHWAKDSIEALASSLVVQGVNENSYAPKVAVTRAEFTAMLVRSLGIDTDVEGAVTFTDVNEKAWYAGSVGAAVKAGLAVGKTANEFQPDALINRAEMAVMMERAAKYTGVNLMVDSSPSTPFVDQSVIPVWAQTSVEWLSQVGITQGDQNHQFLPSASATRAEVGVMIHRLLVKAKFMDF